MILSLSLSLRMLSLLAVAVVSAAVLYVLYHWLIPAAVQNSGWLALIWHDVILERFLNITTGSSRPQVTLAVIHTYVTHVCRDHPAGSDASVLGCSKRLIKKVTKGTMALLCFGYHVFGNVSWKYCLTW